MSAALLGSYWTLAVGAYPWTGPEYCPHDFKLRVETAACAGFTGLGLWGRDLQQVLKTYSFKDMKRILDDNGIVDIEVEWLLDWYYTDERRVASDQMRKLLLDAAEALGARHIKVSDLGNACVALPQLTEHFAALCADAAARGTRVVFEYLPPPLSSLRTVDQVLELTRGSGAANGGIMLDLWHMVRSGTTNAALEAIIRPSDILGVEINDGLLAPPADLNDATINHRLLVGSGEFDVRGFVRTMRKVGYTGHVGVEILNAEIREWTLERAAKAAFDTSVPEMARARGAFMNSVLKQFDIQGRSALVTGAGSGIGLAYAEALAEAGASVTLAGTTAANVEREAARFRQLGWKARASQMDVANEDQVRDTFDEHVREFGRLDIVFANAGAGIGHGYVSPGGGRPADGQIDTFDVADWQRNLDVHLTGVMYTVRHAARLMKAAKAPGSIIVTSSNASIITVPLIATAYMAAKAGVAHFVRNVALELAAYRIRVNTIAPGSFVTNIGGGYLHNPAVKAVWDKIVPLGEMAQTEQIKGLALYLASDASNYMTGAELFIDGGVSLVSGFR